jgi:mRNA interferase RelE/StbE
MTYRILYTQEAAHQISRLDSSIKKRIRKAIDHLAAHPELGKRLTGLLSDRWSYRSGDWRILYKIRKSELVVLILTVGHRSSVYES